MSPTSYETAPPRDNGRIVDSSRPRVKHYINKIRNLQISFRTKSIKKGRLYSGIRPSEIRLAQCLHDLEQAIELEGAVFQ